MNPQEKFIENGKWTFNDKVANEFESMLLRSIPQYTEMRDLVFNIGCRYIDNHLCENIFDIGCSNGLNLKKFILKYGVDKRYFGIDTSQAMLNKMYEDYPAYFEEGVVTAIHGDVSTDFPINEYCLVTSVLTLQFINVDARKGIISNVYNSLSDGGAFIMVEKVLGETSETDSLLSDMYYEFKEENHYTKQEIVLKKQALKGVMSPMKSSENKRMIKETGFKKVDIFWRCLNFEGYIAIK